MDNKKAARLLVREGTDHQNAFQFYCSLGPKRTYQMVAAEFSVAHSTVKLWARSFRWKERLREWELEVARQVANRTLSQEVNSRERNLKIVHMALVHLAKAVADGQVKMSVGDLDKLIRLESFLRNEPELKHQVVIEDLRSKTDEELRLMINEEVQRIRDLTSPNAVSIPALKDTG